jgi:hypothetical protein
MSNNSNRPESDVDDDGKDIAVVLDDTNTNDIQKLVL